MIELKERNQESCELSIRSKKDVKWENRVLRGKFFLSQDSTKTNKFAILASFFLVLCSYIWSINWSLIEKMQGCSLKEIFYSENPLSLYDVKSKRKIEKIIQEKHKTDEIVCRRKVGRLGWHHFSIYYFSLQGKVSFGLSYIPSYFIFYWD